MDKSICVLCLIAVLNLGFTACDSTESAQIYPISQQPSELSQNYEYPLVVNSINDKDNDYNQIEGNGADLLGTYNAEFNYDNTNGSFYYYTNDYASRSESGVQTFKSVMGSVESLLGFTKSCQMYTLQSNSDGILAWQSEPNILKDYTNSELYTRGSGGTFNVNESPLIMWLNNVASKSEEQTFYMYMGDLDEQNALISECGSKLKDYLDNNPDEDFLMLAFTMPFKGMVSYAGLGIDGDIKSQEITQETDGEISKNYYILALGDRDILKLIEDKLSTKFEQLETETGLKYSGAYVYHDYVFSQTVQDTEFTLNAEDITFNLLDADGNITDTQSLRNLVQINNTTSVFSEEIDGNTYIFQNVQGEGKIGFSVGFDLDTSKSTSYNISLDTDSAKVYEYKLNNLKESNGEEYSPYVWQEITTSDDTSLQVLLEGNTVTINRDLNLDIATPVLMVSVPVMITYDITTTDYSCNLTPVSQNALDESTPKFTFEKVQEFQSNGSSLGKTYKLDEFFSHLTMHDVSNQLSDIKTIINSDTENFDTEIGRLNVIITYGNT